MAMATNGHTSNVRQLTRRVYNGEELYFPLVKELQHRGLRIGLIYVKDGVSPQVASGIASFVEDQAEGERHITNETASRYRQILNRLDPADVRAAAISHIGG